MKKIFLCFYVICVFWMRTDFAYCILPAYVDWERGIIISTGKAEIPQDKNKKLLIELGRESAFKDSLKNVREVILRINVDKDITIGEFLKEFPESNTEVNKYINSSKIINESIEGNKIKLTTSLPIDGEVSLNELLKNFKAKLKGEKIHIKESNQIDEELKTEIEKNKAQKGSKRGYKLILLPFFNESDYVKKDIGAEISKILLKRFENDRNYTFLESEEALEYLKEKGISYEKLFEISMTERLILDEIDGIIIGSVTKYKPYIKKLGVGSVGYLEIDMQVEVKIKIFNTKDGKIRFWDVIEERVLEKDFKLRSADDADNIIQLDNFDSDKWIAGKTLSKLISKAENLVRSLFPLEGYVLKVWENRIYINLTSIDGIKLGQILNVYKIGDYLKDPITGENIERIKEKVCKIKIDEVKPLYSRGLQEETCSDIIQPGDMVSPW